MSTHRPTNIQILDFAQNKVTLSSHSGYWKQLRKNAANQKAIILGLGPTGQPALPELAQYDKIYWLDAPDISRQLDQAPPDDWQKISCKDAIGLAPICDLYFYEPGRKIAPNFWGKLLAQLELAALPHWQKSKAVWLPGSESLLLHSELQHSLNQLGYQEIITQQDIPSAMELAALFNQATPQLAISINFRGLDGKGDIFRLLEALKIPLAIWLVDNPWNLLSAIPLPWWQETNLFVTDQSYVNDLKAYGAKNVFFLPLAASFHMFGCEGSGKQSPLFVGRSEFPDKQKFFAGIKLDTATCDLALQMLTNGEKPDYHWWQKQLNSTLWPGKENRKVALGAEELSLRNRMAWIKAGLEHQLRIVGDANWRNLLPNATILPPVDYYGKLPALYANASWTLNVTSLQLPCSLNQRHFDVWAANGFLLTDKTPGFAIFPPELTEPVALTEPSALSQRIAWLEQNPELKKEIRKSWQTEIRQKHLYTHRIQKILEAIA